MLQDQPGVVVAHVYRYIVRYRCLSPCLWTGRQV